MRVRVRVPATSANLGPGFDTAGLALTLYDDVYAELGDGTTSVRVEGEGADSVPRDRSHLVLRALDAGFRALGTEPPDIALSCVNRIPHARGLGSSAAAIVAGLLLARGLLEDPGQLTDQAVLDLACTLEGHPDNVAACLGGGLTLAWTDAHHTRVARIPVFEGLAVTVVVPSTGTLTHEARAVLPDRVPHTDAVFNAARAALLIAALTGAPELLLAGTEDRLHQPYRAAVMPDSAALVAELRSRGLPAVVSGAGPSVLAFTTGAEQERTVAAAAPGGWRVLPLAVDPAGARLVHTDPHPGPGTDHRGGVLPVLG